MAFSDLNDKQKEAVEQIEGPLLILAGAGSGKTSTMTHRIARMIEQGISPYSILAVTFTNKAAGEMRSRVQDLIGQAGDMWLLTFHAMCLRILHVHAEKLGYRDNFIIYDTQDQKTLVKNIVKDKGYSEKEFSPNYVLTIISECKEKEIDPETYREESGTTEKNKAIYAIYREYEDRLHDNNAMDFDDLLLNTVKLFKKHKDVLEKYQRRFQYIMVDEYQDTNHIQYEIVSMLAKAHHNICVVGDDDQCIYEWRGADIRNILDFEKDFPEAKVVKLEQNYRSNGNILKAAHSVIKNNKGRKDKKLWTEKEGGEKIHYSRLMNDKEEAGYVARQIGIMNLKEGIPYSDFAILYRTNAQSRLFEEALTREGIPYRVLSGTRYYDRKEIKDVMAYMRLLVDPSDDLSLLRIINEPKRGIGPKTIDKLTAFAKVRGQSLLEALTDGDEEVLEVIPGKSGEKVKDLVSCINYCRENQNKLKVSDIYDTILVRTGYLKALEDQNTVEADSRIENLMEFKSVIYDYENGYDVASAWEGGGQKGDGFGETDADHRTVVSPAREAGAPDDGTEPVVRAKPSVAGFMEEISLAADVDDYDEEEGTVTLMTMHSAKGLEFRVVFMPGMEDGLFPGSRSFDSREGMEEERRLCYVGMTRAKERMYLTSAEARTLYGRTEFTRESQFLREVDKDVLTGDAVFERRQGMGGPGVPTGSQDGFSEEPYKPFDSLKYATMETRDTGSLGGGIDEEFEAGDRVEHPKFGEGMVIEQNGSVVQVAFDNAGIKKLAAGVAPLKKI